ncbi:MAG: 16S rRNA (uracil(1498)-N(3))-methyltransferase [Saprospiraceae bacterium]|nr:16S rRNA (uracil(1498)-N(3))-methyltransferase [Saprospiraceae bacterium]
MNYFYSNQIVQKEIFFDDLEARHLIKSLRKRSGDHIVVLDGQGSRYQAQIVNINPLQVEITSSEQFPSDRYAVHLAIAPTKNIGRFEWFLEKATELGVRSITPVISHHSERRTLKLDRAKRVLISALKQSGRYYLPTIHGPVDYRVYIENSQCRGLCLIAHCHSDELDVLSVKELRSPNVVVLIGPEGDFTPEEVRFAENHGFNAISLGQYRLRTETAGVYICSLVHLANSEI